MSASGRCFLSRIAEYRPAGPPPMIAIFMKASGAAIGPSSYFNPKAIWRQGPTHILRHPEDPRIGAASRRMGHKHLFRHPSRLARARASGDNGEAVYAGMTLVALEYRLYLVRKRLECAGKILGRHA